MSGDGAQVKEVECSQAQDKATGEGGPLDLINNGEQLTCTEPLGGSSVWSQAVGIGTAHSLDSLAQAQSYPWGLLLYQWLLLPAGLNPYLPPQRQCALGPGCKLPFPLLFLGQTWMYPSRGLPTSTAWLLGESRVGVVTVQENSPAQQAGLEPYFDFIITIGHSRLPGRGVASESAPLPPQNKENDTLKALLKANVEKPVKLEVFSMKTMKVREVEVVPSNTWGGQGLLGASVRFCSFRRASGQVWHVLAPVLIDGISKANSLGFFPQDVEPSSPAALAGLRPYTDYVVGSDQILQESEDFFTLIESHEGKPLKLMVYNSESDSCREVTVTPNAAWGGEGRYFVGLEGCRASLGCGIGYGYLHRIPAQPPSYHKKPPGAPPPSAPSPGTPPTDASPHGAPPPGPAPEDPPPLETGSRQSDYMEALLQAPGSSMEEPPSGPESPSHTAPDSGGLPHSMETPLQPPPPVQRVMDPGFLDVSGISLLDSSNASVWPSLPSSTELISTAVSTSGLEDICSSSSSHERGGEWPSLSEVLWEGPWVVGKDALNSSADQKQAIGLIQPHQGEATWSGSECEVSFLDSPGAQAQADHLPQLTLPESLTSAASPEDGLSAELLEAQAEEEPASTESPDLGMEAEGLASQAQISTAEKHPEL
ncbi:Golgi reassembly-stacking protein 1 [Saguinus oedipus]|uniref:Golgi reassembly-stacking protein 1 n=1 Tax=Saguinus oedipus TaxID=9490 RepID=A0ABQ9U007_SAGOE|nr:Golgi reassembly-stacking protein 1 [Saguinus oedipus]